MAFTHKEPGKPDHKHDTVEQAKACRVLARRPQYVTLSNPVRDAKTGEMREAVHQDPCVCGAYDRCWEIRVAHARSPRDLHRAYND